MKELLQRLLLFSVLVSLVGTGHLPAANYLEVGIWEGTEQTTFAAFLEEECESESETEAILQNDDCEGGGGNDGFSLVKKVETGSNLTHCVSLFEDFVPNWCLTPNQSFSKSQITANYYSITNSTRPLLFLLFHNIKSDLAHPAA